MPRYRVRPDAKLPHHGIVLDGGAIVELPRAIAEDGAVRGLVEEINADGSLATPAPVDDLERFRAHERVSILRERLTGAQAVVAGLEQQLAAEEQTLREAVLKMALPANDEKSPDATSKGKKA